jgi:hypothetical protein
LDFEKIAKKYFECAFGRDGKRCMEYMKGLSELFDPTYLRGEREIIDKDTAERFSGICTYVDEFKEIIESNINSKKPMSCCFMEIFELPCRFVLSPCSYS